MAIAGMSYNFNHLWNQKEAQLNISTGKDSAWTAGLTPGR